MPWESRHGLPSVAEAHLDVVNVTMGNFHSADCGLQSTALALNPSQIDWSPPVHLSGMAWPGTDATAKLNLGFVSGTDPKCLGGDGCDSYRFGLVLDVDGSVGGTPASSIVSGTNPELALGSPGCSPVTGWSAFYCPAVKLVTSVLLDRLRTTDIRMGPITVTRLDSEQRQYFATGPYPDLCARRFAFPRYPFVLASGYNHAIVPAGSLSTRMRLTYAPATAADATLVNMFMLKPNDVQVTDAGVVVPSSLTVPTIASPTGANVLDPQARQLYMTLRGDGAYYDIITTQVRVRV